MIIIREEKSAIGKNPSKRTLKEKLNFGVICIDKPIGPTSHEVSAFVKKILQTNKTGHTGTLDYNVSGVLIVLLNNATKTASYLAHKDKEYICLMTLEKPLSKPAIELTLDNFKGEIYQTPPLASAVAKRLRTRTIHELKILEVKNASVLFKANVQAGTYIRNLCFDFGEIANAKTEMTELRRTKAGKFTEENCITLQELSDLWWLYTQHDKDELSKHIYNIEDALDLKKVIISDGAIKPVTTGANLAIPGINALDENIQKQEPVGIYTTNNELICIAKALMTTKEITTLKKGIAFDIERVIRQDL